MEDHTADGLENKFLNNTFVSEKDERSRATLDFQ
jgi:hypothetical protein